jgi:hypothetical protein
MRRGRSKHDPQRLAAVERQVAVLEWRKRGLSYSQIAARLGYRSRQAAWKAAWAGMTRTPTRPDANELALELARVDALFGAIYERAIRGDLGAIDAALSLMQFRARLLGLDAPPQVELSSTVIQSFDRPTLAIHIHRRTLLAPGASNVR